MNPIGIEVLSLADLLMPEPPVSDADPALAARANAAIVASAADLPTLGVARQFRIDPLLHFGGGGPQWCWPLPWPGGREELSAELFRADDMLNRSGYCGPDDRGAVIVTVFSLATLDGEARAFEGRAEGQFARLAVERRKSRTFLPDILDSFIPKDQATDQERAIDALRQALEVSSRA